MIYTLNYEEPVFLRGHGFAVTCVMRRPRSDGTDTAIVTVGPATVVPNLDVFHHRGPGREVVLEGLLVKHLGLQM